MNTEKENRKISKHVSINLMIGAEFATELKKGYQDIVNNNVISAKETFNNIKKDFNFKQNMNGRESIIDSLMSVYGLRGIIGEKQGMK